MNHANRTCQIMLQLFDSRTKSHKRDEYSFVIATINFVATKHKTIEILQGKVATFPHGRKSQHSPFDYVITTCTKTKIIINTVLSHILKYVV